MIVRMIGAKVKVSQPGFCSMIRQGIPTMTFRAGPRD